MTLPKGVPSILIAVQAMALADALVKLWVSDMSIWQIWLLRTPLVLPLLVISARGRLWPAASGWALVRALLLVLMYLVNYPALALLDMGLVGAVYYVAPLFILILSTLVLGRRIRLELWLAMATGFLGIVFIVRPFGVAFSPLYLLSVVSALCYASAAVLTQARLRDYDPAVLGFWANIGFLGAAALGLVLAPRLSFGIDLPLLFAPWHPMTAADWGVIAGLALLMLVISVFAARAYQGPRPEIVATFDYAYLIFAILWGYLIFSEVPDIWALAGIALIAAGGIGALRVERT